MVWVFVRQCPRQVRVRLCAISLRAPQSLEKGYRHQPPRIWESRVAGFVPVAVIFASYDVEEVSAREAQLLARLRLIVIEGSYYLDKSQRQKCEAALQEEGTNLLWGDDSDGRLRPDA